MQPSINRYMTSAHRYCTSGSTVLRPGDNETRRGRVGYRELFDTKHGKLGYTRGRRTRCQWIKGKNQRGRLATAICFYGLGFYGQFWTSELLQSLESNESYRPKWLELPAMSCLWSNCSRSSSSLSFPYNHCHSFCTPVLTLKTYKHDSVLIDYRYSLY